MMQNAPTSNASTADNGSQMQRINRFLDRYILPYPVKYLTNRVTILATLCLLVPLIIFANVEVFVLAANSYLNVMSVVVSSTVLLYSTISDARDKAAMERREAIAQQHQQEMDKQLAASAAALDKIQSELRQHVNTQLEAIQRILIERIDTNHTEISAMQQAIIDSANAQDKEVDTIKQMVAAIGKSS
ncbi:MAG: hypothetical protein LCI00_00705 [Chloroflexi bacterium]|nr:hypothetical protein [Chloroflexota bacterium]MCC6896950.1 hypothetical protein [Anaerolineae bacterium]